MNKESRTPGSLQRQVRPLAWKRGWRPDVLSREQKWQLIRSNAKQLGWSVCRMATLGLFRGILYP